MKNSSRHRQSGASLIEALISVLIMSLGLLGIAGVQLNALAYQKSSTSSNLVAELVNTFAERIRANATGADNNNYAYVGSYSATQTATFATNGCRQTTSGSCSAAKIASDDVAEFVTNTRNVLPGGAGQVTTLVANTPSSGYIVTVMFLDKSFVTSTGALGTSTSCGPAIAGTDWRNCCPVEAAAPAGVRCRRFLVFK
jgi:type IV pilus assembly protein PilV